MESGIGTNRTWRDVRCSAAVRGKADISKPHPQVHEYTPEMHDTLGCADQVFVDINAMTLNAAINGSIFADPNACFVMMMALPFDSTRWPRQDDLLDYLQSLPDLV